MSAESKTDQLLCPEIEEELEKLRKCISEIISRAKPEHQKSLEYYIAKRLRSLRRVTINSPLHLALGDTRINVEYWQKKKAHNATLLGEIIGYDSWVRSKNKGRIQAVLDRIGLEQGRGVTEEDIVRYHKSGKLREVDGKGIGKVTVGIFENYVRKIEAK